MTVRFRPRQVFITQRSQRRTILKQDHVASDHPVMLHAPTNWPFGQARGVKRYTLRVPVTRRGKLYVIWANSILRNETKLNQARC